MGADALPANKTRRVLVAISGASGSIYGVRLLELMRPLPDVETHMILSKAGRVTLAAECERGAEEVEALADVVHAPANIAAPPSSGSFRMHAMIIAPCSIRTASNIAAGNTGDLISRAADVMLKERRTLIVVPRETPFSAIHLRNMLAIAEAGGIVLPANPGFYHRPSRVEDLVDYVVARVLDHLGVEQELMPKWGEDPGELAGP